MAFKSEIHVAELASIRTGHTEGDIYYILDNGMLGDLPCKPGTFVKWHNDTWQIQPDEHYALASAVDGDIAQAIDNVLDDGSTSEAIIVAVPSSQSGDYTVGNYYEVQGKVAKLRTKTAGDNVTQLTFDTTSGVLGAMNNIVEDIAGIGSPLQWKGPATVAQLNAGITGIQEGWTYTLTDAGTLTDGSVKVDAGDEVTWTEDDEWFKLGGEGGVKYVDTSTSYSDVFAAISRGQLPVMQVFSSGSTLYYFPFYNGYGRIEFRSIQDTSINCFTWNGTAWAACDSVIYGMGSDTKSEVDIDQGVLAIDGGNVVTKVTLATVNAVTFSMDESVPAFAIEIDNTGNSNDVDVTVVNGATTLKYSSAAGNQVGAGKYVQLTCVGGCWTLAEFEAPAP